MTEQEREIVKKVSHLVEKYFYLQNVSGIDDTIPYRIAKALRDGYINCHKCSGKGIDYYDKECWLCNGKGIIEYTIDVNNER